ncbi:MAG: B12-binding domain-containing radical SAM protein [Peptococcaceae bacterium]|nr:B12-binding domain-containing radical SAM protein [Peptococcaceae bacterium]
MKIKLIQPRMSLRPMDSKFKRVMSPSVALLVLAALTPGEHQVELADENAKKLNLHDQPDLVGITVNVDTSKRAYEIAAHYRAKGIPVILGGIHVSANPEEALQFADAVCIGEAETLWATILADAEKGRLKKQYYHSHPTDLGITPVPKWEILNQANYLYTNTVLTSRGCPFRCEFCYNSCDYVHKLFRNKPIENVIREIENLSTKQVMFIDDNFIGNVAWTREFVREIKPLGLKWHAAVSANLVNYPQLIQEMRASGCQSLFIGFETINQASIQGVNKSQNNVIRYEELISLLHQNDIMVNASLVFGFDEHRPEVFKDTLEWLVKNKIETMTAHILTPYPGTQLYRKFVEQNRIIDFDTTHYNTSHVVFRPQNMTAEELYQGYLTIYKEFYSFQNIIRRIPDSSKQRIPYLLFNLCYRKFGKVVSRIMPLSWMNRLGKMVRHFSYGID